jgi:C1A family cysteine protease
VYHSLKRGYRVVNSWSRSWGQSGRAWLSDADMADLLGDFGEAVTL